MKDILFSPTLLFCHRSGLKSDKINAQNLSRDRLRR